MTYIVGFILRPSLVFKIPFLGGSWNEGRAPYSLSLILGAALLVISLHTICIDTNPRLLDESSQYSILFSVHYTGALHTRGGCITPISHRIAFPDQIFQF